MNMSRRPGIGAGRSREGAWIETDNYSNYTLLRRGRSREGAWIEMAVAVR